MSEKANTRQQTSRHQAQLGRLPERNAKNPRNLGHAFQAHRPVLSRFIALHLLWLEAQLGRSLLLIEPLRDRCLNQRSGEVLKRFKHDNFTLARLQHFILCKFPLEICSLTLECRHLRFAKHRMDGALLRRHKLQKGLSKLLGLGLGDAVLSFVLNHGRQLRSTRIQPRGGPYSAVDTYGILFACPHCSLSSNYNELAKPLMSRIVAAYTSGSALRNMRSPAWLVPLTVRLYTLTPAAMSI